MTQSSTPQCLALSREEEIANAISHGFGLLAAMTAAPLLIISAVHGGGASRLVGASVFAASMLLLYATSTLYHALPRSRAKEVFRILDHVAIYVLIAGTYTPFALGVLRGGWGSAVLWTIWSLALVCVIHKSLYGVRYPRLSTSLYLVMGWLCLLVLKPLLTVLPAWGLVWLLAGGVAYTAGVWFYTAARIRYAHFIWHLLVMLGTGCHFIAVFRYAA